MAHAFEISDKGFSAPKPPPLPAPPPPVPTQAQRATAGARARAGEVASANKRVGARGQIRTGPLGLTEEAELGRKTLLGA